MWGGEKEKGFKNNNLFCSVQLHMQSTSYGAKDFCTWCSARWRQLSGVVAVSKDAMCSVPDTVDVQRLQRYEIKDLFIIIIIILQPKKKHIMKRKCCSRLNPLR